MNRFPINIDLSEWLLVISVLLMATCKVSGSPNIMGALLPGIEPPHLGKLAQAIASIWYLLMERMLWDPEKKESSFFSIITRTYV